jgi:hypothetical protein
MIVALAAAVNAYSTTTFVVLPTGNFACVPSVGPDCSGETGDAQLSPVNGIAGISFFTLPDEEISIPLGTGTGDARLSAGGTLNQTLAQNVPVTYNFTLSTTGTEAITSWQVDFLLGVVPGDATYGAFVNDDLSGGVGTFTGGSTIVLLSDPAQGSTLFETVILYLDGSGTGNVNITAPFDLGAVPEPTTVGTLGAGLGLLTWIFHRRKRA